MPELPEVETIKKQLQSAIIGKKLNAKKIKEVRRRGKMIIVGFTDGEALVFHLKITGQLLFNANPSRFTREVFSLGEGSNLVFNDVRKFGWFKWVKSPDEMKEIQRLGPEALEITEQEFKNRLIKRNKAKIKLLLMDQKFLAGIGNIYSDEILFNAKIKPTRLAKTLTQKEAKRLFLSMRKVLKKALEKGGSSVEYYLDVFGNKGGFAPFHRVYQRAGKPCFACSNKIQRIKMAGRSACFCPKCQK